MATAWTPLANLTLGSSASTVTFSSISGSYRDLVLVIQAKNTISANTGLRMRFNSDTGSNYFYVVAEGDGSSTASASNNLTEQPIGPSSTSESQQVINILDYSATDKHKTSLIRADFPGTYVDMLAARWSSTSAITSISIYPVANQLAAGSTFALYGVSA